MVDDLQIGFRPRFEALSDVRDELRNWLTGCTVPPAVIDELVLVVDELCSNAIEATDQDRIHVEGRCDGSAIHLAVTNTGNAPEAVSRVKQPGELHERGRGLSIVRALTDSLAIVNVDGHTVARVVRLLET